MIVRRGAGRQSKGLKEMPGQREVDMPTRQLWNGTAAASSCVESFLWLIGFLIGSGETYL